MAKRPATARRTRLNAAARLLGSALVVGLVAGVLAALQGFFLLAVGEAERFDRQFFEASLSDLGWFGDPARAPEWFRGAIGRHGG